jgi:hypothetical protein
MSLKYSLYFGFFALLICFASCEKDEEAFTFGTKCIKRTVTPNLVGEKIEFAFAMAAMPEIGVLKSMRVVSTFPGAEGTYIDPKSYHTNNSGIDVGVTVADPSTLQGNDCSTSLIVDTCAATLRFYYVVPEEARGKDVSFTFVAVNSNNKESSLTMGPYKVSKMDMTKNVLLKNNAACYFSIKDLAAYTADDISANPELASRIDLVYAFISNASIKHALYAPSAPAEARPDVVFSSGVTADSKLVRTWQLYDQQLSGLQWGIFVDDVDIEKQSFAGATSFLLDLKTQAGTWIETADKTQRAYVYINNVNDVTQEMTISVKRMAGNF